MRGCKLGEMLRARVPSGSGVRGVLVSMCMCGHI